MLTIRELTPTDDFEALGEIYVKSWRSAYRGILPQRYLDKLTTDRWSGMLRARPDRSLGAFIDGSIIGTSFVSRSRDEARADCGEIVSIYLLPEYAGQGYGRALIEAALKKLRGEGYTDVCLWALRENKRAEGFYEHMGFHLTGRSQTESIGGGMFVEVEYMCAGAE